MHKNLVMAATTNYDWSVLQYWVNSIMMVKDDNTDVVVLAFNTDQNTINKMREKGVIVKQYDNHNFSMPIHVERFAWLYDYISEKDVSERIENIVITDIKDVIFQLNPFEFLQDMDIGYYNSQKLIASGENIKYMDEPWGRDNYHQTFGPYFYEKIKENEIYNVGILAGSYLEIRDLCLMIYQMSLNRPIQICDQAVYNMLVNTYPMYDSVLFTSDMNGWACNLGTTHDPNKTDFHAHNLIGRPSYIADGDNTVVFPYLVYNPYYIVHQYDRVPGLREAIYEKYGDKN